MRHVLFILGLVTVVLAFSERDASPAESHSATRILEMFSVARRLEVDLKHLSEQLQIPFRRTPQKN
jgi:hypothetical protein